MRDLIVPTWLELVVFDLDYTLWDAGGTWCDCLSPPFEKTGDRVVDQHRRWVRLYEDVPEILDALDEAGIPMGLASRTDQPEWARELLDLLGVRGRFEFEQIYPGSKTTHFAELRKQSGAAYESMVFFDDESRNIREVGAMGVKCVEVGRGVDWSRARSAMASSRKEDGGGTRSTTAAK